MKNWFKKSSERSFSDINNIDMDSSILKRSFNFSKKHYKDFSVINKKNWYKCSRYGGSEKERGIFYHGTRGSNLQSILSQGLIPDPKEREWSEDSGSNFSQVSRTSYGGVYLTQNLMKAISSSTRSINRKNGENNLIVIIEGQPRSFIADEDSITLVVKDALDNNKSTNEYWVSNIYMSYILGTNKNLIEEEKSKYIKRCISFFEKKFNKSDQDFEGFKFHPEMEKRLSEILDKMWFASLSRQASYLVFPDKKDKDGKTEYNESKYQWKRSYYDNCGKDCDEDSIPNPPDKGESEDKFKYYVDLLTRTLKSLSRSHKNNFSFDISGRSLEPIGFSGSNRIISIVEDLGYNFDTKEHLANVVYGKVPSEFIEDWEKAIGEWEPVKDSNEDNLLSIKGVESLKPKIVSVAQEVYDNWNQDEDGIDEIYGSGGPCEDISREIGYILSSNGYDIVSNGIDEEHASNVIKAKEGYFDIDIPYWIYESGGGYSWNKIKNVKFTTDDITINKLDFIDYLE